MSLATGLHSFVDESGDDGFASVATEWLVISAIILEIAYLEQSLKDWGECKKAAGRRPAERVHWNKLSHGAKKALLRGLTTMPFSIISVVAHKRSFTGEQIYRLKCPNLYFFQTKMLVERISWFARDKGTCSHITFEDRPHVNPRKLKEYIFVTLRKPGRNTQIDFAHVDGFNAKKHTQQTRLEIADTVASAIGNGLNCDRFGEVEPAYAVSLLPQMWIRGESLYSYGLKVIPDVNRSEFELFRRIDEERKKEKAPG